MSHAGKLHRSGLLSIFLFAVSSALCQSTAWSPRALAQDDQSAYEVAVKRAIVEFQAAHWEEAHVLFRRAHELSPNARTWRGLGVSAFELRHYVEAISDLEGALVDPRKPLTTEQRSEAQSLIAQARDFVSVYRVKVNPGSAEVLVDGRPVPLKDGSIALDPGPHTVLVRAPGYQERREDLQADAGVREELSVELALVDRDGGEARSADGGHSTPAPKPGKTKRVRVWTWVLSAAAVAAGATSVGFGVSVHRSVDDVHRCRAVHAVNCGEVVDHGKAMQLATNITASAAGAFAVGAVVAFFLEGRQRDKPPTASLYLTPDSVGVHGTF